MKLGRSAFLLSAALMSCSKKEGKFEGGADGATEGPAKSAPAVATLPARPEQASRLPQALTAVPSYVVMPLGQGDRIELDGKLEEPAWRRAPITEPFVHPGTGRAVPESAPLGGTARLLYDSEQLYIAIVARDLDVRGGFDPQAIDPHLWTKDTVEVMLDPEGDGDNLDYYEIQVSPQGLVFDSQFDSYNEPRVLPDGPFGHQEWKSDLTRGISIQGTLDDPRDTDEGYVVEMAIPFRALGRVKQLPPKPGTVWRMNLYVMQNNGGVSFSPILGKGNFHKASRFGILAFGP